MDKENNSTGERGMRGILKDSQYHRDAKNSSQQLGEAPKTGQMKVSIVTTKENDWTNDHENLNVSFGPRAGRNLILKVAKSRISKMMLTQPTEESM